MVYKYRKIILLLIVILGFSLRYYYASNVPRNNDEITDIAAAKEISFNVKELNLPLVVKKYECSGMVWKYLIRLGIYVFGDSLMGARLPLAILWTVVIALAYFFTKPVLGTRVALLAALLISICQFSIGNLSGNVVVLFSSLISLLLFYKALETSSKKLLLLNGLMIGIGFWFKENSLFLIPIYTVFLFVCPEYRAWLKNKYIWISFAIAIFVMLPLGVLSLDPAVPRFRYICDETAIGISINSLAVYLGEPILLAIKPFSELFEYVASSLDSEYPPVNFALGFLTLTAVIRSIKDKRPFVRLLLVCFLFNFVVFSFLRRNDVIQSAWSIGSLDWGIIGYVPGVILVANMLLTFSGKRKLQGALSIVLLVIFTLIRSWNFVSYPLNAYFPVKDILIKTDAFIVAEDFLREGDKESAKDIFKRIHRVTDKKPTLRREAAFGLVQIFIHDTNYREAKKYLYELLSKNPNDKEALALLEEIPQNDNKN